MVINSHMNYCLSNIQYMTKPSLLLSHSRTLNFSFLISFNIVGSNLQSLTLHSKNPQNYCLSNIEGNLVTPKFKNVWWLWDIYRFFSKYCSSSYMVCKIDLRRPIWSHLWSLGLLPALSCQCPVSKWSLSVVSNPLRPRGLWPARLLHPWDSPGKNTGVGCYFQAPHKPSIFTTQGLCSYCTLPWQTHADRSFRA